MTDLTPEYLSSITDAGFHHAVLAIQDLTAENEQLKAELAKVEKERDAQKAYWQQWAAKRMEIQSNHWVRAAKSAIEGDTRELRNRVELAEAAPVEVVLSNEGGEQICDCERGHNGTGLAGRSCDCTEAAEARLAQGEPGRAASNYCTCNSITANPCIVCGKKKFIDTNWLKQKLESDPDEGEIGAGFEAFPLPAPVQPAVNVRGLIDRWREGEFENDADAAAQDRLDQAPVGEHVDVSLIIEAWLTALPASALSAPAPGDGQGSEQEAFIHHLIQNAFSWALEDCNYLDPIDMDRLIAATHGGMMPEQAAAWRSDAPDIAARLARLGGQP